MTGQEARARELAERRRASAATPVMICLLIASASPAAALYLVRCDAPVPMSWTVPNVDHRPSRIAGGQPLRLIATARGQEWDLATGGTCRSITVTSAVPDVGGNRLAVLQLQAGRYDACIAAGRDVSTCTEAAAAWADLVLYNNREASKWPLAPGGKAWPIIMPEPMPPPRPGPGRESTAQNRLRLLPAGAIAGFELDLNCSCSLTASPPLPPPDPETPPPEPQGCPADAYCYRRPGLVHAPSIDRPDLGLTVKPPPGHYSKITASMTIIHGGWSADRPSARHNGFWLVINGRNRDMLGYLNFEGPPINRVFFRHGLGLTNAEKPKITSPLVMTPGKAYQVEYVYDIDAGVVAVSVSSGGQELARMVGEPNVEELAVGAGDHLLLGLGFSGDGAHEPATIGWEYWDLSMVLRP